MSASNTPSATPSVGDWPIKATQNFSSGSSLTGGVSLGMPAGIESGNLILHFCTQDDPGATSMAISGYTELFQQAVGSVTARHACFGRIATGSDAATLTGADQAYAVYSVRITNHGVGSLDEIRTSVTTGTSATPDPPSLNTGLSGDWMWIASAGTDTADFPSESPPWEPTGYTAIGDVAGGGSACATGLAYLVARKQTEDPGTFTMNASHAWVAATLAVPGLGEASSTVSATPSIGSAPTGTPVLGVR